MTNKRRSRRLPITASAEVVLPGGATISSSVANISSKGIGLYIKPTPKAKTPLTIWLTYQDETGKRRTKRLDGEVQWAHDYFNAVGIALKELSEKDQEDLLQYMKSIEELNKP